MSYENPTRRVVCISGTGRPGNYTSMALRAVERELRSRGLAVESFDGRELTLGFPGQPTTDDAERMRTAVAAADGVVIATPEYHGCFSAMTKLVIENLGFPSALARKPVALLGVAGGRIGAVKSLEQLRGVCSHVGALVLPGPLSIATVRSVFDDRGECTDEAVADSLRNLAGSLIAFLDDFVCPRFALEAMVREETTGTER